MPPRGVPAKRAALDKAVNCPDAERRSSHFAGSAMASAESIK
jgi:hypothetical protein